MTFRQQNPTRDSFDSQVSTQPKVVVGPIQDTSSFGQIRFVYVEGVDMKFTSHKFISLLK